MWRLWSSLIVWGYQAQIGEAACQCEHIPTVVADEQQYASYLHHQVALPTMTELQNLTSEVKEILAQTNCRPTTLKAGPGETLFACPAGFVPCPVLSDLTQEVLQACNDQAFVVPLPFLVHHGKVFRVDEVQNIKLTTKNMASKVLEVDDLLAMGMSAAFHFVYK